MLAKPEDKSLAAEDYANAYDADYGFEAHLVRSRQGGCLRFLESKAPRTVLEVGCGNDLLAERLGEITHQPEVWHIVEPAERYAVGAKNRLGHRLGFGVTVGYLEGSLQELKQVSGAGFDAVILSGVLHETTDPARLLRSAHELLADNGSLLVDVPNANSMHRLLAVHMGLIDDPATLSERNKKLGQGIVHTPETIRRLLEATGFSPLEYHGHMLKFLTNSQMQRVIDQVGDDVATGLDKLGQQFPAYAAEFAYVAQKA